MGVVLELVSHDGQKDRGTQGKQNSHRSCPLGRRFATNFEIE
ncbi:unnamed protein product [Acidithrix sp. C25]|nr:unnamed protein product [Acidithrix sp. C25]